MSRGGLSDRRDLSLEAEPIGQARPGQARLD